MALDPEDQSAAAKKVKFLCSFGGKILPRPSDGALRYVGGQTRIIALPKAVSFPELMQKMRDVYGGPVNLKYQLPDEDLDALISVSCGEDVENMMEEYQKLAKVMVDASPKLRVFLFVEGDGGAAAAGDVTGHSYMEAVNGIGELRRKESAASLASTQNSDGAAAAAGAEFGNENGGGAGMEGMVSSMVQCSSVQDGPQLVCLDAVVSRSECGQGGLGFSHSPILASVQVDPLISTDVRPEPTISGSIRPEPSIPVSMAGYFPRKYADPQQEVFNYVNYVPNSGHLQYLTSQQLAIGGAPAGFVTLGSNSYMPGLPMTTVPPPPAPFLSSIRPTTSRLESCLEGNEHGRHMKIPNESNHKAFQSLSQLPPLPPSSIQASNIDGYGGMYAWPQVSLPSQQAQQGSALRLEDCLMCQKALPHAHSDTLIQDSISTVSQTSPAFHNMQNQELPRSNDPYKMTGAVLTDDSMEQKNDVTNTETCGYSHIPKVRHDIDSITHHKIENFDQSRLPFPSDHGGFPSDLLSLYELYPNHNAQATCEGSLQQQQQHQPSHFVPGKHLGFQEISTPNPIGKSVRTARYDMLETLGPPSLDVRNETPSDSVLRPVELLVEKLNLNLETAYVNEQLKIVEKSNASSPKEMMPENKSLIVESRDNPNSQVGESNLFWGDAFVNPSTISGGSSTKVVEQPLPSVLEVPCLHNEQTLDSKRGPTLLDLREYPNHPGIGAEPPIPHVLLLGVPNAMNRVCDGDRRENSQLHSGNGSKAVQDLSVNNLPSLPSNLSELNVGIRGTQRPTPSDSLFSDPDPWRIVQNGHTLSPKTIRVACGESMFLKESCIDNHPPNGGESLISIPSEKGDCYELLDALNKDSFSGIVQPVKDLTDKQITKDMQDVMESMAVPSLRPPVPRVLVPNHETNESVLVANGGSVLHVDSLDQKDTLSTGDKKIEDMKKKQSDKLNHGFQITEDVGRLQIIKNSDLEELRELGSGTYGTVYHGKWRGSDVAIKRINDRCFAGKPSDQERLRADFWNEASNLADLHHPNVVAFYGVVLDGPGESVATLTEYMVNGSLRHALQRNDKTLDQRKRLLIAMDVAFGMEYLHGKNVVHFDLKSDNLLVNLRDPQRPICKVGDLGLSKVKRQTLISGGVRGTLPWMAPELLNGCSSLVTEKVDVFSFGIVMWELLTGEEPYADLHYGTIIGGIVSNTLRPSVPDTCDPKWKALMEKCWSAEPSERPSFTEIAAMLRSIAASLPEKGEA